MAAAQAALIFGVAVLPTLGSSVAIPMGIGMGFHPVLAVALGTAGAICKVPLALWLAGGLRLAARRWPTLDRRLIRIEDQAARRLPLWHRWGFSALTLCAAVPVPGFGIWTAAFAGRLLGLRPLPTGLALTGGLILSGTFWGLASVGLLLPVLSYIR